MGYYGTPPSDPPNTIGGLGSIASQTLSFSDSDRVELIHRVTTHSPPYFYDFAAEKSLRIQFGTPNDGISHNYSMNIVSNLINPATYFNMTSALECYTSGVWLSYAGTGYHSTSSIGPAPSPGIFDASYGYGHFYLNGISLPPNATFRLSCQCDNSILGVSLGNYFDYSVDMAVFCADFSGGAIVSNANNISMIIEQN